MIFRKASPIAALAAALAIGSGGAIAVVVTASPAIAQSAAKALVDKAKAAGQVGEQGDGYLGLVTGQADAGVSAAVDEINSGRRAVYQETAAKTGVTPEVAGQATAAQLYARMPAGQFYRPIGGGWTQK